MATPFQVRTVKRSAQKAKAESKVRFLTLLLSAGQLTALGAHVGLVLVGQVLDLGVDAGLDANVYDL